MTSLPSKLSSNDLSDSTILTVAGRIMSQLPGIAFTKTKDSVYVAANPYSAHLYGFKKANQMIGLNDYELKSSVVESADEFRSEDRKIFLSGTAQTFIHINNYLDDKRHCFLTYKIPIENSEGRIIGLNCIANEVANLAIQAALIDFLGNNKYLTSVNKKRFNFKVSDQPIFPALNLIEAEILYFFSMGLTQMNIGALANLSLKNIEKYLEEIQFKLKCNSLKELLDLCLENNYHAIVPRSILNRIIDQAIFSNGISNAAALVPDNFSTQEVRSLKEQVIQAKNIFRDKITGLPLNLSQQQHRCLYYLMQAKSAKEIAQEMNLSYRTIEHYLLDIRRKHGYISTKQLLANLIFVA